MNELEKAVIWLEGMVAGLNDAQDIVYAHENDLPEPPPTPNPYATLEELGIDNE